LTVVSAISRSGNAVSALQPRSSTFCRTYIDGTSRAHAHAVPSTPGSSIRAHSSRLTRVLSQTRFLLAYTREFALTSCQEINDLTPPL
jgi:hypothetical protein